MGGVYRRQAGLADDVLCALVLPAAVYVSSSGGEAATAGVLAAVALFACLSEFHCESALSLGGGAAAVLTAGWALALPFGQVARLALLAAAELLTAGTLLTRGGGSATGGEALLLGQAAALLCAASAGQLPELLLFGSPLYVSERAAVIHLLQTAFCLLLGLLLLLSYLPSARQSAWLHLLLVLLAGAIIVTTSVIINTNCLLWMVEFATGSAPRLRLLTIWASLLGGAVLFAAALGASGSGGGLSRAVLRKLFHLLICAVFVPGLLYDPLLLLAASGGITFLFIIAEIARACRLQPWADIIQRWFRPFLDSKDGGFLVLSNIFLVAACSGVLWYHAGEVTAAGRRQDLSLFAGVITVGIGDTVAAVVGSRYGRTRWPQSSKTIEGSLAAIAAQLLFCYALDHTGYLYIGQEMWRALCVAIGVTTLAEAFTAQADNLLLPPLFVIALRLAQRHW
ncbi:dolichol kinase-like [Amphibalanus amphitrite]|uniref:dolichol kinase-like n=1 Tax=Amphibalanus amphitrite TaxID=1232801 RepID=UPI001C91B2D0|nr:dolichol kinase-like [Amphibalanus amphitrite]XP_043222282.1 dolichol kinase-like [Amphibalanus amphitrite]